MIINASPTLTLLLLFIGETGHVAVVVVTPHQRHIIGHLQAALQDLQHLFIRNKNLRYLLHLFIIILTNQFTLVVDHLLQALQFLLLGLHALHRTVVDATHADGKELLGALHLLEALYPVLLHLFAVGDVIVCTTRSVVPLGHVVAQQGFAVTGADEDAARVGHLLITWNGEETWCAGMHAWPDGVGPQAQHQLKNSLVGLGAHTTKDPIVLKILPRPVAQAPVLIVDKDATIGHAGGMLVRECLWHTETRATLWHHIAPPYPRRHASLSRQFKDTVGRTAAVMSLNQYLSVFHAQAETVVRAFALHNTNAGPVPRSSGNRPHPRHLFHITTEHLQSNLYDRVGLAHHLVGNRMLSVEPHHVGTSCTDAYSHKDN